MRKNLKLMIALVGIAAAYAVLWLVTNSSNTEAPESYPLVTSSNTIHDVSADILKVANHGNPDATSKKFAKRVSPEVAIITTDTSEDANSANKKVIGYFNDAQIYVTQDYELGVRIIVDEQGNISVVEA